MCVCEKEESEMASYQDTDPPIREAGAALADLFVEGKAKMIWRFVTFMCPKKSPTDA